MNPQSAPSTQPVWSRGNSDTADVAEHLFSVARSAAHATLKNWRSDEDESLLWAAVSVGLAVETGIKCALAKVHPLLLADKSSKHDAYLLLAGVGNGDATPESIYTIGATEASIRVRGLSNVSFQQNDTIQVFAVRNSAAHMGLVDRDGLATATRNMVTILENLLGTFGTTSAEFWGEHSSLVFKILSARSTELQQRIETKKLTAARFLEELQSTVNASQLELLLTTLETQTHRQVDGVIVVQQECPVCHRLGYLKRDVSDDYPTEGGIVLDTRPSRFRIRFAYPEKFDCPVCRLSFNAEECFEVDEFENETEIEPDAWTPADADDFETEQLDEAWSRWK